MKNDRRYKPALYRANSLSSSSLMAHVRIIELQRILSFVFRSICIFNLWTCCLYKFYNSSIHQSLGDCGSSKLYLSMCPAFVAFISITVDLIFYETWCKCWYLKPTIVSKFHFLFNDDVIMLTFLISFAFLQRDRIMRQRIIVIL